MKNYTKVMLLSLQKKSTKPSSQITFRNIYSFNSK